MENLISNQAGHDIFLNIGAFTSQSRVNGPGLRFVIWVHGCSICCKGCINPQFADKEGGRTIAVNNLYKKIIQASDIEGVTFTGGEPFEQPKALSMLASKLKSKGISVMCYSGYTLNELKRTNNQYINALLDNIDILIDGRYVAKKEACLKWRGSLNQNVYFLSKRYNYLKDTFDSNDAETELFFTNNKFTYTGFLPHTLIKEIKERLIGDYGINLKTIEEL